MATQRNDRRRQIIGQRIRQALDDAGKTQADLAREIGATQPQTNRWVKGHVEPRGENLESIAEALGRDVAWFVRGLGRPRKRRESGDVIELDKLDAEKQRRIRAILEDDGNGDDGSAGMSVKKG